MTRLPWAIHLPRPLLEQLSQEAVHVVHPLAAQLFYWSNKNVGNRNKHHDINMLMSQSVILKASSIGNRREFL